MTNSLILPALILIPIITGLLSWFCNNRISAMLAKWVALLGMVVTLILSLYAWQIGQYSYEIQSPIPEWALEFQVPWIPMLGISIHLAMDGMSLLMVALTALLGILAVGCSWQEIQRNQGAFFFNLLWSLGAVIGVFLAIDMFLFFFFWEMMLIPIYFLISLWGHNAEGSSRKAAAMKFFIYTQVAGLIMLVGIISLVIFNYVQQLNLDPEHARLTFDYMHLLGTQLPQGISYVLMLCFFIGFAVKLPVFPLHGWLPDAHAQAPTAGSVDLAGILIKTAAYGLLRFTIPFFPEASLEFANIAIILGLIGIFYGAWCAFQQTDMKRLLAYTSISHMGFVLLAIYSGTLLSFQGLMVMMLAHGLSSAALFIMCGQVYERLHTRDMRLMGGIRGQFRYLPFFLMFFVAALVGVPGLGNFIGEFLILMGSFARYPVFTIISAVSLVVAGVYGLILIHRTLFGEPNAEQQAKLTQPLKDLSTREIGLLMITVIGLIWLGMYPQTILDISNSSMGWITQHFLPVANHSMPVVIAEPTAIQHTTGVQP